MEPVRNIHRAEAHRAASLAGVAHYELAGAPATGALVRALAGAFPDATTLYLVGAQFTPVAREALTRHSEWVVTSIPAGTGWPDNWYEAARLRVGPEAFGVLAGLADEAGLAAVGTAGALFRHDELVAEWLVTAGGATVDLLEVTAAVPAPRLRRLALALSARATAVAPAA